MATSLFCLIFQSILECGSPTPEKMEVYLGILSSDDFTDSSILDNNNINNNNNNSNHSPSDSSSLHDPYTIFTLQQQQEILRHQMRVTNNKDADISMFREHFHGLFHCDAIDLAYRNKEGNTILLPELEAGLLHRYDAMDMTYRSRRGEDNSVQLDGFGLDEYFLRERTRMETNNSDDHDEEGKKNPDTTTQNVAVNDYSYRYMAQLEKNYHDCEEESKTRDACDASQHYADEESYSYVIRLAPKHTKKTFSAQDSKLPWWSSRTYVVPYTIRESFSTSRSPISKKQASKVAS